MQNDSSIIREVNKLVNYILPSKQIESYLLVNTLIRERETYNKKFIKDYLFVDDEQSIVFQITGVNFLSQFEVTETGKVYISLDNRHTHTMNQLIECETEEQIIKETGYILNRLLR